MPIKKYTIAFRIDDAMAQAAIKRSLSGLEAIDKAAKRAGASMGHAFDVAAQAAAKSSAAQVQATTKAAAAATKAQKQQMVGLDQLRMSGIKLGDQLAASAAKEAKAREAAASKAAATAQKQADRTMAAEQRKTARIEQIESRFIANDYRRRVRHEANLERLNRKLLTDEQITARVRNAIIDQTNQRRIDAAMKAAGVEKQTLSQTLTSFVKIGASALGVRFTVQKIMEAGQAFAQAMKEAGEESHRMAQQFGQDRDELGELASIADKPLDQNFVLNFARFNKATGFRPEESKRFQSALLNSGAQYVGRHISEGQFSRYNELVGQFAVANKMEPEVVGDLAGQVLASEDFSKHGEKAAETALGRLNSVFQILKRGRGDNPVLLNQFTKSTATLVRENREQGIMQSLEDVAKGISVQAEQNPEEAEVFQRNAVGALRKFNDEKAGPLLAEAKITASDHPFVAAGKLRAAVSRRLRSAPAGTKEVDILNEHFDEREVRGLSSMMNGIEAGVVKDREEYAKKMGGSANAIKQIENFQKSEAFRLREAQADVRLSEAARGAENSKLDILRTQAKAYMVRNKLIGTANVKMKQWAAGKLTFGMLDYSDQALVDLYGSRMLNARIPGTANDMPSLPNNPEQREALFNRHIGIAEGMGVDPLRPLANELAETNKLLRQMVKGRGNPAPPPLPAAPRAGPGRP